MESLAPEHFPDSIVDAYLEANIAYPQSMVGMRAAMGSVATQLIVAGGYSWDRFLHDSASDGQLQEASKKIVTAHGDIVPFRPGEKYTKEDGVTTFPMQRVSDLMHSAAVDVAGTVNGLLVVLHPDSNLRELLLTEQYHDYFEQYEQKFPKDIAAISVLFGGVHTALMAKNDQTRGIRQDLYGALRGYYKIDLQSAEGRQEMEQIAKTLDLMRIRFRSVIHNGYYRCLPEAEAVLGRSMPPEMGAMVMKKMSGNVQIPGDDGLSHLIKRKEDKTRSVTLPDGPQGRGSA